MIKNNLNLAIAVIKFQKKNYKRKILKLDKYLHQEGHYMSI